MQSKSNNVLRNYGTTPAFLSEMCTWGSSSAERSASPERLLTAFPAHGFSLSAPYSVLFNSFLSDFSPLGIMHQKVRGSESEFDLCYCSWVLAVSLWDTSWAFCSRGESFHCWLRPLARSVFQHHIAVESSDKRYVDCIPVIWEN